MIHSVVFSFNPSFRCGLNETFIFQAIKCYYVGDYAMLEKNVIILVSRGSNIPIIFLCSLPAVDCISTEIDHMKNKKSFSMVYPVILIFLSCKGASCIDHNL